MKKLYIYFLFILFLPIVCHKASTDLFQAIDANDNCFLTRIFETLPPEKQYVLLSQTNARSQTPLHYVFFTGNLFMAAALIEKTQEYKLFLQSDDDENTPLSLAQEIPDCKLVATMCNKIPDDIRNALGLN